VRKLCSNFNLVLVFLVLVSQSAFTAETKTYWKIGFEIKDLYGKTVSREQLSILLETKKAPKTTQHIIGLVKSGFFDSQRILSATRMPKPFHFVFGDRRSTLLEDSFFQDQYGRRIDHFNSMSDVITKLDSLSKKGEFKDANGKDVSGNSGAKIPLELTSMKFDLGTVGLSHEPRDVNGDNLVFITLGRFPFLDDHYTAFGKVVAGSKDPKAVLDLINHGDMIIKNEIEEITE